MGINDRRNREKQSRNEEIIKVATQLFAKKGFQSCTMDMIAEKAELSKGVIYAHFKSKAELLYAVMEPLLQKYYREVDDIVNGNNNVKETADIKLIKLFDYYYNNFIKDPSSYQILMFYDASIIEPAFTSKRLARLKKMMRLNLKSLEKLLQAGVDHKIFKPLNPKSVSTIIWNMVLGIFQFEQNRIFSGKKSYIKEDLNQALDMILFGIKSDKLGGF